MITVGQVYTPNDPRDKGREVQVVALDEFFVHIKCIKEREVRTPYSQTYRTNMGRVTAVQIHAFQKKTQRGYTYLRGCEPVVEATTDG